MSVFQFQYFIFRQKRLIHFQQIAEKIKKNYKGGLLNSTVEVLFENKMSDSEKYFGRDKYSNSVIVKSDTNLSGQIRLVKINHHNQNTLFGELAIQVGQQNSENAA